MTAPNVYTFSNGNSSFPLGLQSLKALLDKAIQGEETAFHDLYNLCFDKIYRFIYYRVGHKETAEDLTEEVFIKAFASLRSLQNTTVFEGWLYQIARNRVIDFYRNKKIVIPLDEIENTLEYEQNIIEAANLQFDQQLFLKALQQLPSEQQQLIKLKFLEQLENDHIALIMNKSEGTIRVMQHRAVTKLKELIKQLTNNE
jgi:RNA polymerase sigma-70 factor, ECF subfamily